MDPVSLIVMALVQGAVNALTKSTEDAVTAGLTQLKRALFSKADSSQPTSPPPPGTRYVEHPSRQQLEHAVADLEADPHSLERQRAVAGLLRRSGIADDPEVLQLSGQLFGLIEDPLASLGDDDDPVEVVQREAGVRALSKLMDGHVGTVMSARSHHVVEDTELLTPGVHSVPAIPEQTRNEIAMLHTRISIVIDQISQRIEDGKFAPAIDAVRTMPLGAAERQRALSLVESDKQIHVSYQKLRNTVEFFSRLNDEVLLRVEHEQDVDVQSNMMLGNAVLIFELTEYVIRYIERFAVDGDDDVRSMHREMVHRIASLRSEQERLREQADADGIDEAVRRHTLEDITHREGAITELESEWLRYLHDIDAMHERIGAVREKLPTLKLIRENARIQIDVLQLLSMVRFLRQNTDAIRGAIDVLTGLRLAPMSAGRVRKLLGVQEAA